MTHDALLPNDPLLPQLPRALDAAVMAEVFGRHFAPQAQVAACEIERVKYRPRRNCSVAWRLELIGRDGRAFTQRVAGRFCAAGESLARHQRNAAALQHAAPCGVASLHDAALELAAWCLPNDPRLAALPALCGAQPVTLDGFALHTPQLVQYVPEQRATARAVAESADGRPHTLFVKTSLDASGGATHAAMQALAAGAAVRGGRLRLPRSIAWQATQGLHWQQGVPGIALADHAAMGSAAMAARVGAAVAALHGSEAPVARHATAAHLLQRLRDVIDLLWFVNPRSHAALERIGRTLGEQIAGMDLAVGATLHGDLHPRNLLVDGEDLWLIDLDSLWLGAPVLDLGAWIADGLYRDLLAGTDPRQGEAATDAFVAAYRQGSQRHVDPQALQAAVLYQLVCERAQRCLTTLKPGRFEHLGELIERADAMAAQLRWRSAA